MGVGAVNAEERERVKSVRDSAVRSRLAREGERRFERELRRVAEAEELPQAAEHVPPMTERELASLRSRRLRP